jgi:hypothetical protein
MTYRMHRVFCATSLALETERRAFYQTVGGFNESEAMLRETMYVPVTLTNMPDKRRRQDDVDENLRACRHYILALDDGWGPPERNFEGDYRLAVQCREDPALPMQGVQLLVRCLPDGAPSDFSNDLSANGVPHWQFVDTAAFRAQVRGLMSRWMTELDAIS